MSEIKIFKTPNGEERKYQIQDHILMQAFTDRTGKEVWCTSYYKDFDALVNEARYTDITPVEEELDFLNDLGDIDPTSYQCEGADDCDGCKI